MSWGHWLSDSAKTFFLPNFQSWPKFASLPHSEIPTVVNVELKTFDFSGRWTSSECSIERWRYVVRELLGDPRWGIEAHAAVCVSVLLTSRGS